MPALKKRAHHKHKHDHDLYADVEKIKAALKEATQDIKGKAAEIVSDKSLGIALLVGVALGYLLHR